MSDTKEVLDRIDALAAKLGVAAQDLLAVLVAETRARAWASIAFCVCGAIIGALAVWVAHRFFRRLFRDAQDADAKDAPDWLAFGAAVCLTLILTACLHAAVSDLLAPTRSVLGELLR